MVDFGSFWVVLRSLVGRCGSLWIVLGHFGSFWVVPRFSNYDLHLVIAYYESSCLVGDIKLCNKLLI